MRVLLLAVVMGLLIGGCAGDGESRTLTDADNGARVQLTVGDAMEVALEANPSTGYTWEVSPISTPCVRLTGEPDFTPMGELLGAGGVMTLDFDVVEAGRGELVLVYHRTWEDVAPLHEFVVSIDASD